MNQVTPTPAVEVPSFVAAFAAQPELRGGPAWLGASRRDALDRFAQVGLPTQRLEDWKYTSLAPLGQIPFTPGATSHGVTRAHVTALANSWDGPQLVFVNGRWARELSEWNAPAGTSCLSFAEALASRGDLLEENLGRSLALDQQPLAALNSALATEGVVIELAAGAQAGLVHLTFLTASAAPVAAFPRLLVLAGKGAQASLLFTFAGTGGERSLTDLVAELRLAEGADVTVVSQQRQPDNAAHVALVQVVQAKGSRFASHGLSLGAALAREEVRVRMEGEGCSCTLNGLYLASGTQHLDQHTVIDHAQPRCTSRELYKGVLDGQSRGVFTGRVLVRQDAQKTDSQQTNKNLLLSEQAQVDSRPQLEIFADDVKCTHGSAVGQLDDDALFYLRSRGIDREKARGLLTHAFVSEVVDGLPSSLLQLRWRELISTRLAKALA